MNYDYTAEDRLEQPHKYMYARFGGKAFLTAYMADRRARCDALPGSAPGGDDAARVTGALQDPALSNLGIRIAPDAAGQDKPSADLRPLDSFSVDATIETSELLEALFDAQFAQRDEAARAFWLRRLTQRFEVSKKLYQRYPPGFRKGDGPNDDIRLYALFSLTLALAWHVQPQLQHLSTLLKLNDLLLSLPPERLTNAFPADGVRLSVATELNAITRLANEQGIRLGHD
ncbi:hypothetical protein [Denitromonas ohlonensis]|uniref:Uncharacterized protein n=2 Tax=Denitromonas TaxID=139331 RepID=A0A557SE89_9RHOO|nr:hypothetical protein [Denitromonas ohlonensis]TVO60272.1 hypothetical protein FHP90_18845 [Denitromonas ohlonensis]TVO75749.1 hypothetical protein FHP89_12405 [Denitromonas ohlonensis]